VRPDRSSRESGLALSVTSSSVRTILQPFADWCRLGVRDPSLLVDRDGRPVRVGERFVLYFNGRDRHLAENGITRVGSARSRDLIDWEPDPAPAFEDGDYATTAGAIEVAAGTYRLYYAFDTARGFRLAESPDGAKWSIRREPILTPGAFSCRRIGLPFVFWHRDRWLMLLEGLRSSFAVYAAASDDGLSWQPMNDGEPVYAPAQDSWDALAQANPSLAKVLIEDDRELPCLFYNGCVQPGDWDLGLLTSPDPFVSPWQPLGRPFLTRADMPSDTGRLEGARFIAGECAGTGRLLFFALPARDAFEGARIMAADVQIAADAAARAAAAPEHPSEKAAVSVAPEGMANSTEPKQRSWARRLKRSVRRWRRRLLTRDKIDEPRARPGRSGAGRSAEQAAERAAARKAERHRLKAAKNARAESAETAKAVRQAVDPETQVNAEAQFNDELAQRYFQIWQQWPIQRLTHAVESRWLLDLVQPGETVLLVGSGGGREIETLLPRAGRIVAMDISPEMLRIGAERYRDAPVEWRRGDAQDPPADLTGFDHAIGVGGVLCYLPQPEAALVNLRRTLRPGGRLTLGIFNAEHATEAKGDRDLSSGRVRRVYSVRKMRSMLAHACYVVEAVRGHRFFVDALPPSWNAEPGVDSDRDELLARFTALESDLVDRLAPEQAKHLWVVARAL
jgi:SAM-dependent methyltransferase